MVSRGHNVRRWYFKAIKCSISAFLSNRRQQFYEIIYLDTTLGTGNKNKT